MIVFVNSDWRGVVFRIWHISATARARLFCFVLFCLDLAHHGLGGYLG